MKHMTADMSKPAPATKPVMASKSDTSRPESKGSTTTQSSAPADMHTLGRVSGKDWLK